MNSVRTTLALLGAGLVLLVFCAPASAQVLRKAPHPKRNVGKPSRSASAKSASGKSAQPAAEGSAKRADQQQFGQAVTQLRATLHQEELAWLHTHPHHTSQEYAAERQMLKNKYNQELARLRANHKADDQKIERQYKH